MNVILVVGGLLGLVAIAVLIGVSMDTEGQRRKRRAVATERQRLREEGDRILTERRKLDDARRRLERAARQQRRCLRCPFG